MFSRFRDSRRRRASFGVENEPLLITNSRRRLPFGGNFLAPNMRFSMGRGQPEVPYDQNIRFQWARAETYVIAKLRSGSHPSILQQCAQTLVAQENGDPQRMAFNISVVRILTNLQGAGQFNGLPSLDEFGRLQDSRLECARMGVMMRNRFGNSNALLRYGMDNDMAPRARALDRQAEQELQNMREREWQQAEERYRTNEEALRAELAELKFRNEGARTLRDLDDRRSYRSRAPSIAGPSIYDFQDRYGNRVANMPPGYYGAQMADGVERPFEGDRLIGEGPYDARSERARRSQYRPDRRGERSQSRGLGNDFRDESRSWYRGRGEAQSQPFNMKDISDDQPRAGEQSDAGIRTPRDKMFRDCDEYHREKRNKDQEPPPSVRGFRQQAYPWDFREQPGPPPFVRSFGDASPRGRQHAGSVGSKHAPYSLYKENGEHMSERSFGPIRGPAQFQKDPRMNSPRYSRDGYEYGAQRDPRAGHPRGFAETIHFDHF